MISAIASFYLPRYVNSLVYMLQKCEYQPKPYIQWYWRTQNFSKVANRGDLKLTKAAKLLKLILTTGMILQIAGGLLLLYLWHWHHLTGGLDFGLAAIISYPVIWGHLIVIPLWLGRVFVVKPNEKSLVAESSDILKHHKGVKIAVAGSYGKTSMKELLLTVLSEGKSVAATPANKNVSVSIAQFAKGLSGKEDVVIIEYGEGAPGDIARFVATTHPNRGVITGVAPAHLDRYKTVEAAGKDIFGLADYLDGKNVYVNGESPDAEMFIKPEYARYDQNGALGWKVSGVKVGVDSLGFVLKKNKQAIHVHSHLIGRHQIGPLSLAVALSKELDLKPSQIERGISNIQPFEHRMQPYKLNEAWVIDDTYNGNIEGIRAGCLLLAELSAKRKMYVTPGLVDQGGQNRLVHETMGRLIAEAKPNIVVLMRNSVTHHIEQGLREAKFSGELRIETNPLDFYKNLNEFVAAGDVVMLQNDWPDNYS